MPLVTKVIRIAAVHARDMYPYHQVHMVGTPAEPGQRSHRGQAMRGMGFTTAAVARGNTSGNAGREMTWTIPDEEDAILAIPLTVLVVQPVLEMVVVFLGEPHRLVEQCSFAAKRRYYTLYGDSTMGFLLVCIVMCKVYSRLPSYE